MLSCCSVFSSKADTITKGTLDYASGSNALRSSKDPSAPEIRCTPLSVSSLTATPTRHCDSAEVRNPSKCSIQGLMGTVGLNVKDDFVESVAPHKNEEISRWPLALGADALLPEISGHTSPSGKGVEKGCERASTEVVAPESAKEPSLGRTETPAEAVAPESAKEPSPGRAETTAEELDKVESSTTCSRCFAVPLDAFETEQMDTKIWSEDVFGTILHKPSNIRVSPEHGIKINGVVYELSPDDIDMPKDSVLGSGAGGVVQVGWHRPTGRQVAVKTIRVGADVTKKTQMLNEIMGLSQAAGCPYLIQWYAGFADASSGDVRVALEYMDLGSFADLRSRLAERQAPSEQVTCIAAQITRGLEHLQERKMLHRDVKPENILHNRRGCVKLTDFGISKTLVGQGDVGATFVGTAIYMAPERACGFDYCYSSDVWSAGLVVYELAMGRYPFPKASFIELYECLCEGPEPRLDAAIFPKTICDFVARCLTKCPDSRPDAVALRHHPAVVDLTDFQIDAFAAWLRELSLEKKPL